MTVDHAGGRVYWTNSNNPGGSISFANLDGSGNGQVNTSGATMNRPWGLALDPAAGRLYWLNTAGNVPDTQRFGYARLDGSGAANLSGMPVTDPFSLAFANGTLYWTGSALIAFASVTGSGGGQLPVTPATTVSIPRSVAIDPIDQRIYWTNVFNRTIASAKLDGSDARLLPIPGATVNVSDSLAIDPAGRRIYWINKPDYLDMASIQFADLDGSGGGTLQLPAAASAKSIAVDPVTGRILWTTDGSRDSALRSANRDGSDVRIIFSLTDATLRAPVIDDAPPASTPIADASLLYHAVDTAVTLSCTLDDRPATACSGRSSYANLPLGPHCFAVREQRNGKFSPPARACWTVTKLAAGCTTGFHHGYFITASSATIDRRLAVFHATTDGKRGRIALTTRTSAAGARVAYRLDGKPLGTRSSTTLKFAQLNRKRSHTLTITVTANGHHARITRHFRYASFVAVPCGGRKVVGRIPPRTVHIPGTRVTITAEVPKQIRATTKLRFLVKADDPHALRAAHFSYAGKKLDQHALNAALTAQQLSANGSQVLTIALVPTHGRTVTVRIPFRTRSS